MRELSVWKDRVSRTQSHTNTNATRERESEQRARWKFCLRNCCLFFVVAVAVADNKIEYLEQKMNDTRQGQLKIIIQIK